MKNDKIIYYWASNELENNGEGILAKNFLHLLKIRYKNFKLVSINKFKNLNQNTFFYKYALCFWGAILMWKYFIMGKRVSYINFLPAWNFLLIAIFPPKTILGPITGSYKRERYNNIIKFLTIIGLKILKIRYKKILFSHDFFSSYFKYDKNIFYNFLLYKFELKKNNSQKKYDFIFYIKNHENKMNQFLIKLIYNLSEKYKICIIGEKIVKRKNVYNAGFVKREKAIEYIRLSKAAVSSPENLFSFFLLDCLSCKLLIFYNKDLKREKNFFTNLLIPIDFKNFKKSLKIIKKNNLKKISKKIKFNIKKFDDYL